MSRLSSSSISILDPMEASLVFGVRIVTPLYMPKWFTFGSTDTITPVLSRQLHDVPYQFLVTTPLQ